MLSFPADDIGIMSKTIESWYPDCSYIKTLRLRTGISKSLGPAGLCSYALLCQDAYFDHLGLTCKDIADRLKIDKETVRRRIPKLHQLLECSKEGNCEVYRAVEPVGEMAALIRPAKTKIINHWSQNYAYTCCLLPAAQDISIGECLLMGVIYSLAEEDNTRLVQTTIAGLAALCGESRQTIRRHLEGLEAIGLAALLTKTTKTTMQVSVGIRQPSRDAIELFAKRTNELTDIEREYYDMSMPAPKPITTPKPVQNIVKTTPVANIAPPKLPIYNSMDMERMYSITQELRKKHRYNHHWGKLTDEAAKQIRVNECERYHKKCRDAKIDNRVSDIAAACILNCWISNAALNEAITKATSPLAKVNNPSAYLETLIHTMLENDHNNMRE